MMACQSNAEKFYLIPGESFATGTATSAGYIDYATDETGRLVEVTGTEIFAGITYRPCGKDDLKKALKLANKYLPSKQDDLVSVTYSVEDVYLTLGHVKKESDRLREQADKLDQKDRDLQFIENVLSDRCD